MSGVATWERDTIYVNHRVYMILKEHPEYTEVERYGVATWERALRHSCDIRNVEYNYEEFRTLANTDDEEEGELCSLMFHDILLFIRVNYKIDVTFQRRYLMAHIVDESTLASSTLASSSSSAAAASSLSLSSLSLSSSSSSSYHPNNDDVKNDKKRLSTSTSSFSSSTSSSSTNEIATAVTTEMVAKKAN